MFVHFFPEEDGFDLERDLKRWLHVDSLGKDKTDNDDANVTKLTRQSSQRTKTEHRRNTDGVDDQIFCFLSGHV